MSTFEFPENNTEFYDFQKLLGDNKDVPLAYVQSLNIARQRMCDALASQPASQAVIEAIEAYLPSLQYVLRVAEQQNCDSKRFGEGKGKFKWRSVLSKGIHMSLSTTMIVKPMVAMDSIWYEALNVLLSLAYTLANMANKRIGNLSSAGESLLTEGADLLCRAAGVFKTARHALLPRWRNHVSPPPELCPELLDVLSELMLADANRLAMAKAQRRGMSSTTLIKLGAVVMNGYEKCAACLKRLSKANAEELADPFRSYVEDGAHMAEALLLRRYAELKHETNENGIAVASITRAQNDLVKCLKADWIPYKKMANDLMGEYNEFQSRMVKINNNITYQRIPEIGDVKAGILIGRAIAEIKPYTLPDALEPRPVKEEGTDAEGPEDES